MKFLTLTLAAGLTAGMASAAEVAPEAVQFDDSGAVAESLTGVPGDPAEGAKVVGSKKLGNCVACHQVSALADVPFQGEIGPVLDGVGSRWGEAELRGILTNAKKTFDGTMMPAYYKTSGFIRPGDGFTGKAGEEPLPPLLTAQQIEDTIAFLMTLKDE